MGNFLIKPFDSNASFDLSKPIDPDNPFMRRVLKTKEEMTGMERVRMVFSKDEFDEITPELQRCIDATLMGLFVGGAMGGMGRSRIEYMDFMRQNKATTFETKLQAKKALQDRVFLGMGSGAFRIGWRVAAFTFIYMTSSTIITAYRGKIGVLDQVGGAGIAGFLYKFRDGPKAAVAGTIFGSAIGLFAGGMTFAIIKIFGMDMEAANMKYYHRLAMRQDKVREATLGAREDYEKNDLVKYHERILAATEPAASKTEGGGESQSAANAQKLSTDSVAPISTISNEISHSSSK